MKRAKVMLALVLAACSGGEAGNTLAPQDLESAAIERGLIRDPDDAGLEGLYARDTDRMCIVGDTIGVFVDYGDGTTCSGSGRLTRAGDGLRVRLGDSGCSFGARFEGDRIVFPGVVPAACAAMCSRRASFAGVRVERLSESTAEARALRDTRGRLLCGR